MDSGAKQYTLNTLIVPAKGRTEVFFETTIGSENVYYVVKNYGGAFLNTCGGVVHFGVKKSGRVVGVSCTRAEEDKYRLEVDNVMKYFQPKVSPSLYRLDFIPVVLPGLSDWKVISLHVSAGSDIMYMDGSERVMMMASKGLYGPLYPQEIQRLAIHKYKQELINAENLMKVITPVPRDGRHSKKLDKRQAPAPKKPQSSPVKKATTCISTQTTPRPPSSCATAEVLSTQTTPGLRSIASDHSEDHDTQTVVAAASSSSTSSSQTQQLHMNCTDEMTASTPASCICLDDDDDDDVIIIDLNSTIITIKDSDSDSGDKTLDQTGCATPVRNPSDLFASPGCSTIKKQPQERQPPMSPTEFPTSKSSAAAKLSSQSGNHQPKHKNSNAEAPRNSKKLRKS